MMRPTPLRIHRTPSRIRANHFFWRRAHIVKSQRVQSEITNEADINTHTMVGEPENRLKSIS